MPITPQQSADFVAVSQQAANVTRQVRNAGRGDRRPARDVTAYVRTKQFNDNTVLALRRLSTTSAPKSRTTTQLRYIPQDQVRNFRNDMYLVSEALRVMQKSKQRPNLRCGHGGAGQLQEAHRPRDEVHSDMGEGCGRPGAWSGNDDRLEADRGDRRRKNRQRPSDLRPGRRG